MRFLKQSLPLLIFLIAIPVGYFAGTCGASSECSLSSLLREYVFTVFKPLWIFSFHSLPAVIFLPFVSNAVFKVWKRFALIWLAISLYLIVSAPESMSSWFYVIAHAKSDVASYTGTLFSIISLILLPVTYLVLRARKEKTVR